VARGGDQRQRRAAALDQRVRAERRGVADRLGLLQQPVRRRIQLAGDVLDRLEEALRQVVVRGERLGGGDGAVRAGEAVGERASDVDVDLHQCPSSSCPSVVAVARRRTWRSFSASMSSCMSWVIGCPGGRYSTSTW